jgi:hypothetical protein
MNSAGNDDLRVGQATRARVGPSVTGLLPSLASQARVRAKCPDGSKHGRDSEGRLRQTRLVGRFDAFGAADAAKPLEPEDLEGMAKAGWWTGRPNESIAARERAYAAYVGRGDKARAAFAALTLRREYNAKLQGSVAQGWLKRAETLLDGEPESTAHGYLAIAHGQLAWGRGELDHALSHMERAIEIAGRFDDRDLPAWAEMYKGMVLVDMGRVEEGWLLMEAVSAAAVGGELGGYTTGGIFLQHHQHVPRSGGLWARDGMGGRGKTVVRATGDHRLPGGLPGAPGRGDAAGRRVDRGRTPSAPPGPEPLARSCSPTSWAPPR